MQYTTLSAKDIFLDSKDIQTLLSILKESNADIVVAGELLQYYTNGAVRKHIVFEHVAEQIVPSMYPVQKEPAAFSSVRWNVFKGYCVCTNDIAASIPPEIRMDPDALLVFALAHNFSIRVASNVVGKHKLRLTLFDIFSPRMLVQKNQRIRNLAIQLNTLLNNVKALLTEVPRKKTYYQSIDDIKKKGEIVVQIAFGGLGDSLAFTTLPRLLKEIYNVDFYLSKETKKVFRNDDIKKLCFEMNPFFKGFKESDTIFRFKSFISDRSLRAILTDKGGDPVLVQLEKQFGLVGLGRPELYYTPKQLPGYEHTLLCDINWFSGEKWGLYNDPNLLEKVLTDWKESDSQNTIEYITPHGQNIFEYIDKIHSAVEFVSYFSGGNALAVSLQKKATVIVPENLDGNSVSLFFFAKSPVTYLRKCSLASYY